MTKQRPSTLEDVAGRRLTDGEIDYLLAMLEGDHWLMHRIRNGYPAEERSQFGKQFLDAVRMHVPNISYAQAAEALGEIVIKVRRLNPTQPS
jgi:hypothetical protein